MTKQWRKYWKEKGHVRKRLCNDFMGIDSFHIFAYKEFFAMSSKDYFAFNNYDQNYEPILKVDINNGKFHFYINEYTRKLVAVLAEDGFHVAFIEFFINSSVGYPTITKRLSYKIPIERQTCNGCTFFHCPGNTCNRRMRKLYYSHGIFLCRKCLKLGYSSQLAY